MGIWNWFINKFTRERSETECERCGYEDEEANICDTCGRTICDLCMADFVTGNCLDCEQD